MSTPRRQFARVPKDINVSLLQEALVVVVGVGMVGSQIAEGLTRFTVGNIRLIDHEPYEWENTLRHALPVEYDGWNKAIALEDWLPKQIEGLRVEAIPRKVDTSMSDDELDHWLGDADLVVAATDDREAQRRIGRRALAKEVAAVFPALYPRRGGGEVILQLVPELPCFGCWDYFRRDTEQLRGQRALDLDAQPVIFHAEQLCLGALDPDSKQRDLLRADPPHQVVMVDRIGVPSFGSITRRLDCPSCGGGQPPLISTLSPVRTSPPPSQSFSRSQRSDQSETIWRAERSGRISERTVPEESAIKGLIVADIVIAGIIALIVTMASSSGSKASPKLPPAEISSPYNVKVDYSQPLPNMISAAHLKQGDNDPHVTDQEFPATDGPAEVAVVVVHLTDFKRNDPEAAGGLENAQGGAYIEALTSLNQLGLRPANLPELLAFSEQYPEAVQADPIVELGSLAPERNGDLGYGAVFGSYVELGYTGEGFNQGARFLAMRK